MESENAGSYKRTKAELLARYTNEILNQDATPRQIQKFWQDVEKLPPEHRCEVKELCETARQLKKAYREEGRIRP